MSKTKDIILEITKQKIRAVAKPSQQNNVDDDPIKKLEQIRPYNKFIRDVLKNLKKHRKPQI